MVKKRNRLNKNNITSAAQSKAGGEIKGKGESSYKAKVGVDGEGSVQLFLPPAIGAESPGASVDEGSSHNLGTSLASPSGGVDCGASLTSHVISGASVASYKRVGRSLLHHKPMAIDVMFAPSLNPQFSDIPLLEPSAPALCEKPSNVL